MATLISFSPQSTPDLSAAAVSITRTSPIFDLLHSRYPNSEWAKRYPKFKDASNQ